jgi:hypothetical protein
VREWLQLFELTHQVYGGYGWVMWQRTSLLVSGGIEDQPAKDMEALTLIARIENAALAKRPKRERKREPKKTPRG